MATIDRVLDMVSEITETDRGTLTGSTALGDIPWDSLAVVGFIAAADEAFGKVLSPGRVAACATIADLAAVVEQQD
ncbi:MAG: hypothetical protein H6Q86_4958 [candidate division NC10 bacterium]|nr:hypothetical protein [candidate division NC10 bacterium]